MTKQIHWHDQNRAAEFFGDILNGMIDRFIPEKKVKPPQLPQKEKGQK